MRPIGIDNAWFSFKGIKSTTMGVRMSAPPVRMHPERKGEWEDRPGTDGELWIDGGGYNNITVQQPIIVLDTADIDRVNAWLTGYGELVFGDEPDRAYKARIAQSFTRTNTVKRLRGQTITVPFNCSPFRYEADPVSAITISEPRMLNNPGTVEALPLIAVYGSGNGTLMIGDGSMLIDDLTPGTPIMIDCEAKRIYTGNGTPADPYLPANDKAYGDWLRLLPGTNGVNFSGGITEIVIAPRWRWI